MKRVKGREENLIDGPEAEGLKDARTNRLIALNICDTKVTWSELKDYVKLTVGVLPLYVNVYHGIEKNWGILEFPTMDDARRAIDLLNGKFWRGAILYLRQDRDDRSLSVDCQNCCAPRKVASVGEWWGSDWFCTTCTSILICLMLLVAVYLKINFIFNDLLLSTQCRSTKMQ